MTSLERRALLGDRQAQEELSWHDELLSCPCCKDKPDYWENRNGGFIECTGCGLQMRESSLERAIKLWNTRPVPPIGFCGECAMLRYNEENEPYCKSPYGLNEPDETNFCGNFMPKEENYET